MTADILLAALCKAQRHDVYLRADISDVFTLGDLWNLEAIVRATGGLEPALVAKTLAYLADNLSGRWHRTDLTTDEITELTAATFEVLP